MSIVWLNGALLPEQEARLNVLDRGVIWGYGLFETLRAYRGRLWAFDEHDARLRHGSEVLDLPVPAPEALRGAMDVTLEANGLSDAGVRVTVTRGAGPPDPHADATEPPNVIVTAWPLRDYSDLYRRGALLITLPDGGRPLAGVKSTSYAPSVAGRVAARRAGADDGLFVTEGGGVLETTGSNVMVIRDARLVTPPVDEGVLPGVTRRTVLEVAGRLGLGAEESPLSIRDLFDGEEVLLTSSLREIYHAASLDDRELPSSGWAPRLREEFGRVVRAVLGV